MFCKYCGKQLGDGEICDCAESRAARTDARGNGPDTAEGAVSSDAQTEQNSERPLEQSSAGEVGGDESSDKPARGNVIGGLWGDLVRILKNQWSDPRDARLAAGTDRPYLAFGVINFIAFWALFFFNSMYVVSFSTMVSGIRFGVDYHFWRVLLMTLATLLMLAVFYLAIRLTSRLMSRQKLELDFLIGSYAGFSVDLIPVTAILIVGGLLGIFSQQLCYLAGLGVFIYLIFVLAAEFYCERLNVGSKNLFIALACFVMAVLMFAIVILYAKMAFWCTGIYDLVKALCGVHSNYYLT